MKLISFHISGRYGHFLRAEGGASAPTYPVPPRTVILGILGAVLGLEKDQPQILLEPVAIALSGRLPQMHWHSAKLRKDPPEALPKTVKRTQKAEKNTKHDKKSLVSRLNQMKPDILIKDEHNKIKYRINVLLLIFFGLTSGGLAGLLGVGGGFLKTPIMIKAFNIPAKIAAATARFMIIITSVTGTISYAIQGHIHLEYAWPIILGFAGGAIFGHKLTLKTKDKTLEIMIGVALIMAGLVMTYNFIN